MPEIDYGKLAEAMLLKVGQKAVGSTPTAVQGHGPGGIFSSPALDRAVFSAMVLPITGLQSRLLPRPSTYTHPLFGIFTGVTATTGNEPSGVCDDPPVVGLVKLCSQAAPYGRQGRMTRVYDLDTFGRATDRGEHFDFQLQGNPFQSPNLNVPTSPHGGGAAAALQNDIAKAMFEFAVAWARDFAPEVYTGNPANNTAGGGRKYFRGLDILINTGKVDAETNVACPAADSWIDSFGNNVVGVAGSLAVQKITRLYRVIKDTAQRTGLMPVVWTLAMRPSLFYALTEVWPCAYLTYRCTTESTSTQGTFDMKEAIAMRDAMRAGSYLVIDGERVDVSQDDAIVEDGIGQGTQQSQIYFVPLTVLGGVLSTYMEYFDYSTPNGAMEAARLLGSGDSYFVSDNGRFFWHKKPPTNFCVQMLAKTETRIVLRTPHISGRLTNVRYQLLPHERDAFTTGTYFVDGGGTSRTGPSYY